MAASSCPASGGAGLLVDAEASSRSVAVPATYQKVTRTVVDVEILRARGYKFDDSGDIVATPEGDRVLRAASIAGAAGAAATTAGAASGEGAYVREITVPAEYRTVTRQVLDQPATVRMVPVAATHKTMARQVVDTPATTREADVPAVYDTNSTTVKVGEPSVEWRSILCETNATPAKLREIQRALLAAGFNPGPIDGVIQGQTMKAINAYQAARGLAVDSYLNLETVKSLGVSPK